MRRVLAICIVACSSPSSEPPEFASAAATSPPLEVSDAAPAIAELSFGAPAKPAEASLLPRPLWMGRHGVPIAAVFATEDGTAVVSIDKSNHARLWPGLDGTHEPLVLPLAMPRHVVIVREGDGFAIAAVDVSGGLEVLAVNAAGELVAHERRPPEPGVAAVVAHDGGFLVLHRDQRLELIDTRGVRRSSVAAVPGEHVLKLLARNGRTLALVRTKEGVRGRWVAGDPAASDSAATSTRSTAALATSVRATGVQGPDTLAWGELTPKLRLDLDHVFLSPDHTQLATHFDTTFLSYLVDLDSGRSRELPLRRSQFDTGEAFAIGFASASQLVFAVDDFELSQLQWRMLEGGRSALIGGNDFALEFVAMDRAVVTNANVISFSGHELAIATPSAASGPSRVRYLGYRANRAKGIASSPAGVVAKLGSTSVLLDEALRVSRQMPALTSVPLGGDLLLASYTANDGGKPAAAVTTGIDPAWLEDSSPRPKGERQRPRLALHDLASKQELQRWPAARAFHFEPATGLLAIDRGTKVELATLDPAARTVGASRVIDGPVTHVALLDPAVADGRIALLLRQRGVSLEVRGVLGAEVEPARTLAGTLEAVDRVGRLYLRVDPATLAIERDGHDPVRLAIAKGLTIVPSPTGDAIAVVGRDRLGLVEDSGATRWEAALPGISDAAWALDGHVVVVVARDIAKVDVATGRVTAAQCGWGFALRTRRPEPFDFPSTTATTCDH
jgi:hypothetical protein